MAFNSQFVIGVKVDEIKQVQLLSETLAQIVKLTGGKELTSTITIKTGSVDRATSKLKKAVRETSEKLGQTVTKNVKVTLDSKGIITAIGKLNSNLRLLTDPFKRQAASITTAANKVKRLTAELANLQKLQRTGRHAPVRGAKGQFDPAVTATDREMRAVAHKIERIEKDTGKNSLAAAMRAEKNARARQDAGPFGVGGGGKRGGATDPRISTAIENMGEKLASAITKLGTTLRGKGTGKGGGAPFSFVPEGGTEPKETKGQQEVARLLTQLQSRRAALRGDDSRQNRQDVRQTSRLIGNLVGSLGGKLGLSAQDTAEALDLGRRAGAPNKKELGAKIQGEQANIAARRFAQGRSPLDIQDANLRQVNIGKDFFTESKALIGKLGNFPSTLERSLASAIGRMGERGQKQGINKIFSADRVKEVIAELNTLGGMGKQLEPLSTAFLSMASSAQAVTTAMKAMKSAGLRLAEGGIGTAGQGKGAIGFATTGVRGGKDPLLAAGTPIRGAKALLSVKAASEQGLIKSLKQVVSAETKLDAAQSAGDRVKATKAQNSLVTAQNVALGELTRLSSTGALRGDPLANDIAKQISAIADNDTKRRSASDAKGLKAAETNFDKESKALDRKEKIGFRKADALTKARQFPGIAASFADQRQEANAEVRRAKAGLKAADAAKEAANAATEAATKAPPGVQDALGRKFGNQSRLRDIAASRLGAALTSRQNVREEQKEAQTEALTRGRGRVEAVVKTAQDRLGVTRGTAEEAARKAAGRSQGLFNTLVNNGRIAALDLAKALGIVTGQQKGTAVATKESLTELRKQERAMIASGAAAKQLAAIRAQIAPLAKKEEAERLRAQGIVQNRERITRGRAEAEAGKKGGPTQRFAIDPKNITRFTDQASGVKAIATAFRSMDNSVNSLNKSELLNDPKKRQAAVSGALTAKNFALNQIIRGAATGVEGLGKGTALGSKALAFQRLSEQRQKLIEKGTPAEGTRRAKTLESVEQQLDRVGQGLLSGARATGVFGKASEKTSNIVSQFGKRVKSLSFFLGAGFLLFSAVARIRAYAREVVQLQEAFARIQGIVQGRGLDSRLRIEKGTVAIAKEFGANLQEVVKTSQIFVQTGIGVRKSLEATRSAIAASIGGGVPISQARETAIAVERISGGTVTGEDIATRIARTESQRAVVGTDLSVAIQRLGAFAKQLQPDLLGSVDSFDAVIGLVTTIVETTRVTGNQAATALKFILARLSRPEVGKKLEQDFGIALGGGPLGAERRPLTDILADVSQEFRKLNTTGQGRKAAELAVALAGGRQIGPAIALLQNFERAMEIATESSLALGDIQERTAISMATAGVEFRKAGVAIFQFVQAFVKDSGLLDLAVAAAQVLGGVSKKLIESPGGAATGAVKGAAGIGLTLLTAKTIGTRISAGIKGRAASVADARGLAGFNNIRLGAAAPGAGRLVLRGLFGTVISNLKTFALFLAGPFAATLLTLAALAGIALSIHFIWKKLFKKTEEIDPDLAGVRKSFRFTPLTKEQIEETSVSKQFRQTGAELGLSQGQLITRITDAARVALARADLAFGSGFSRGKTFDTGGAAFIRSILVSELDATIPIFASLGTDLERTTLATRLLKEAVVLSTVHTSKLIAQLKLNATELRDELLERTQDRIIQPVTTGEALDKELFGTGDGKQTGTPIIKLGKRFRLILSSPIPFIVRLEEPEPTRAEKGGIALGNLGFALTGEAIQRQIAVLGLPGFEDTDKQRNALTTKAIETALPVFGKALLSIPGVVEELQETISNKNKTLGQALDELTLTIRGPVEDLEGIALTRRNAFDETLRNIVAGAIGLSPNARRVALGDSDQRIAGGGTFTEFLATSLTRAAEALLARLKEQVNQRLSGDGIKRLEQFIAADATRKNRLAGVKPRLDDIKARGLITDRLLAALIKFDIAIEKLTTAVEFQALSNRDIDPSKVRLRAIGGLFDAIATLPSVLQNDLRKQLNKQIQENSLAGVALQALGLVEDKQGNLRARGGGPGGDFTDQELALLTSNAGNGIDVTSLDTTQAIKDRITLLRNALNLLAQDTGLLNQFTDPEFLGILDNLADELNIENVADLINALPKIDAMLEALARLEGNERLQIGLNKRTLSVATTNDTLGTAFITQRNKLQTFDETQRARLTGIRDGPIQGLSVRLTNIRLQQDRKISEARRQLELKNIRVIDALRAARKPEADVDRFKREQDLANKIVEIERLGRLETQRLVLEAAGKGFADIQAEALEGINNAVKAGASGLKSVLSGFRSAFPEDQNTGQFVARLVDPIANAIGQSLADGFIEALVGEGGLIRNTAQDLFKQAFKVEETRKLALLQGEIIEKAHLRGIGSALGPDATLLDTVRSAANITARAFDKVTQAIGDFQRKLVEEPIVEEDFATQRTKLDLPLDAPFTAARDATNVLVPQITPKGFKFADVARDLDEEAKDIMIQQMRRHSEAIVELIDFHSQRAMIRGGLGTLPTDRFPTDSTRRAAQEAFDANPFNFGSSTSPNDPRLVRNRFDPSGNLFGISIEEKMKAFFDTLTITIPARLARVFDNLDRIMENMITTMATTASQIMNQNLRHPLDPATGGKFGLLSRPLSALDDPFSALPSDPLLGFRPDFNLDPTPIARVATSAEEISIALSKIKPLTTRLGHVGASSFIPVSKTLEGQDFPAALDPDDPEGLGGIHAIGDASHFASTAVIQFGLTAFKVSRLLELGKIPGLGDAEQDIDPTKPPKSKKRIALEALGLQALAIGSQFAGTALGNAIGGKGKNSFANEGASILGAVGTAAFGPLGGVAGSLVGGIIGGFFGRGEPEEPEQLQALQRIERNTREQIEAIENQTRQFLNITNRLLLVPASFVLPGTRPINASAGGNGLNIGSIVVHSNASDPRAVAAEVTQALRAELSGEGTFSTVRI